MKKCNKKFHVQTNLKCTDCSYLEKLQYERKNLMKLESGYSLKGNKFINEDLKLSLINKTKRNIRKLEELTENIEK